MIATRLTADEYEKSVTQYLVGFRKKPKDEAKKEATERLIRMGLLNEDGSEKEQIVNGDFFGW